MELTQRSIVVVTREMYRRLKVGDGTRTAAHSSSWEPGPEREVQTLNPKPSTLIVNSNFNLQTRHPTP